MNLYNTLTRGKEELVPVRPPEVGVYTCGPTVYDYATIGNMRAYIFMDTLRRVPEAGDSFEFGKLTVTVTKTDGRRAEECEITVAAEEKEKEKEIIETEIPEAEIVQEDDFI